MASRWPERLWIVRRGAAALGGLEAQSAPGSQAAAV